MDSRLFIQLSVDPACNIVAVDRTNYDSWEKDITKHVMLEFLTDLDGNILNYKLNPIIHKRDYMSARFMTAFPLKSDGTFRYYKLIVPTLFNFETEQGGQKYFSTADTYFFYKGKFYYSEKDLKTIDDVASLTVITDFFILWDNKEKYKFLWFDDNVFSICKLERCLVSLQKKIIDNCYTNKCETDNDLKYKRDFILDSIFVLKYLISVHNYTEAQRILDNLSSCGNICGDGLNASLNNGCNCGNTI